MSLNQHREFSVSAWLMKKGSKLGFWHRRFCIAKDNVFIISRSEDFSQVKRKITIEPNTIIQIGDSKFSPKFNIILGNNEKLTFACRKMEVIRSFVLMLRSMTYATPNLSMRDFEIISVLGRGGYGKVLLCKYNVDGEYYAIKVIKKNALNMEGQAKRILIERNLLHKLSHPFIVPLKFAFRNAGKVYLGLEYASGGDLYYHMSRKSSFLEVDVKLILASISLALDYLHKNGIIYRDLKPENVVFDSQGYAKLTDFGLSKEVLTGENTAKTFCGTAEYLAPEIIMGQSYDHSVDWWALGVLAHELLYGTPPFSSPNKNALYNSIMTEEPKFPPNADNNAVALIKSLLSKDPSLRPTLVGVQNCPFFEGLNFDDLYERKIKPTYSPPMRIARSLSNFDSVYTNEVPLDSVATPVFTEIPDFDSFTFYPESNQYCSPQNMDDIQDVQLVDVE